MVKFFPKFGHKPLIISVYPFHIGSLTLPLRKRMVLNEHLPPLTRVEMSPQIDAGILIQVNFIVFQSHLVVIMSQIFFYLIFEFGRLHGIHLVSNLVLQSDCLVTQHSLRFGILVKNADRIVRRVLHRHDLIRSRL